MSGPSKNLPSNAAELLADFREQFSCANTQSSQFCFTKKLEYSESEVTDPSLAAVRTKLNFDSPQQDATCTDFLFKSKLPMKRPSDCMNISQVHKRLNISPGGIDWSPASKEQRNRILETVDSRINELQSIVSKNKEFKRDLMDIMDAEKLAMQRQKERDQQTIKTLQQQVQNTKDEMYELEQKLIERKGKFNDLRIQKELEIQSLQSEKNRLESSLYKTRRDLQKIQSKLEMELDQCQDELSLAQNQAEEQGARLAEVEEQLAEFTEREFREEALQAELHISQARIQELEAEVAAAQASAKLRETPTLVSSTSRRVRELEEQVASSREMLRGKLLLEETNVSLQQQLVSSSKMVQDLATLEQLCKSKDSELKEWHKLACNLVSGEGEMPTARVVSSRIQKLEQTHLVLKNDLVETMSQLRTAEEARNKAEKELRTEQEQHLNLKKSHDILSVEVQKTKRKLHLITQERDSIRNVLAAYEGDITVVGTQLQQLQHQRIESAEQSAKELRGMVDALEKELALTRVGGGIQSTSEIVSLQHKLESALKDLETEKTRSEQLEERAEKLEMLLEQRALRGDFDPAETKVMHFRMNPAAQEDARRNTELVQLRQSNDKLRERVRVLETAAASGSSALNTTTVVEEQLQIQSNKQLTETREKLKQAEIKAQRLVDAFKKTSQSFRQAVYLLFGYKTDALADNNFRLSSMYAEREDEHLLFKILGDDRVEMIQTSFSETVPELIKAHLDEQGSIPAFLSALTLDLFSRQTFTS